MVETQRSTPGKTEVGGSGAHQLLGGRRCQRRIPRSWPRSAGHKISLPCFSSILVLGPCTGVAPGTAHRISPPAPSTKFPAEAASVQLQGYSPWGGVRNHALVASGEVASTANSVLAAGEEGGGKPSRLF